MGKSPRKPAVDLSQDEVLQTPTGQEEEDYAEGTEATGALPVIRSEISTNVGRVARVKRIELSPDQQGVLIATLKARFEKHPERHQGILWGDVEQALVAKPDLMISLQILEETGGEPDVFKDEGDAFLFGDCSEESPIGRRNVVFNKEAQDLLERKEGPKEICAGNAVDMAREWGVNLMSEIYYRELIALVKFDGGTSSWLETPVDDIASGYGICGARVAGGGVAAYGDNEGLLSHQRGNVGKVVIGPYKASCHGSRMAFRCVLRVPKV